MKLVVSIVMIFLFMFQLSMKWILIANYEMNKEYISKTFCENKEKKSLHCNGKCYLSKELQKEEENESKQLSFLKGKAEGICEIENISICPLHIVVEELLNNRYIIKVSQGFLVDIFWPPTIHHNYYL